MSGAGAGIRRVSGGLKPAAWREVVQLAGGHPPVRVRRTHQSLEARSLRQPPPALLLKMATTGYQLLEFTTTERQLLEITATGYRLLEVSAVEYQRS